MPNFDVVILTESEYLKPMAPGNYVRNILKEDRLVQEALEKHGLKVSRKDWADPHFDWSRTVTALFRSTWDYFERFSLFNQWFKNTSSKTRFINSATLVTWNVNKSYLNDLANKGIRIIPTRFIPSGSGLSLPDLIQITGWQQSVVKPAIGGGGRHTYHITPNNLAVISNKLQPLMREEDFMLQPFQYSVADEGEWSLIFIGDQFSHAVLKKARPGDFRVQDDFGGTVHEYQPTPLQIDFAASVIDACPEKPVYARVDVVRDNEGALAVSELELIEPELWFRLNQEGADLLANEITERFFS